MSKNPLVNRPPLARNHISKPKLLPKITRKGVAAIDIVKQEQLMLFEFFFFFSNLKLEKKSHSSIDEPPILKT